MLFNKLIGRRLSIVEDTPGVTRDRIYGETDWSGRAFTLIDTGGIEPRTDDQILTFMDEVGAVVEGYYAAESVYQLGQRAGVEMPICTCAYQVLYQGRQVRDVVTELMTRSKKDELGYDWM